MTPSDPPRTAPTLYHERAPRNAGVRRESMQESEIMTNELNAKLAQYGIDYAEAMERFGGNEALFVRLA